MAERDWQQTDTLPDTDKEAWRKNTASNNKGKQDRRQTLGGKTGESKKERH